MASTQARLKVVSVDNAKQLFGKTEYATFKCETEDRDVISVAVSHNALEGANVNLMLLDYIVGSTLVVQDDTDVVTKKFSTGVDKVSAIVNGTLINPRTGLPSRMLMLNRANSTLLKCEGYMTETKDLTSSVLAKYQIEKDKEKRLASARRAQDILQTKLQSLVKNDAMLDTNEEEPF